jgi:hypothetical protein
MLKAGGFLHPAFFVMNILEKSVSIFVSTFLKNGVRKGTSRKTKTLKTPVFMHISTIRRLFHSEDNPGTLEIPL